MIQGSKNLSLRAALIAWFSLPVLLTGCTTAPDHTDAWLSIKYGFNCGDAQHCAGLTDFGEADSYYHAIGADQIPVPQGETQFRAWLDFYNFPSSGTTATAQYANAGDLQIGRDMNCWQNGPNIACYVTNYGPPPFFNNSQNGDWPNLENAVDDTINHNNPFATVAMVYNPNGIGINGDKVVFYVFDQNGALVNNAALDGEGPKTVPRMCMACHGGTYDPGTHSATGINFLPFDVQFFYFSPTRQGFGLDDQQEGFRQLNAFVLATQPIPSITTLINGLYNNQVNTPFATIPDDTYIPADWATSDSDSQKIYKGTFRKYCRMCHVASAAAPFNTFSEFKASAGQISNFVCGKLPGSLSHDMPHAEVPFGGLSGSQNNSYGFWMDGNSQNDLKSFLSHNGASCP